MEISCIPIGMGVGMTHTVAEAAAAEAEAEDKEGSRKGPWTSEEDTLLRTYISCYGQGRWDALAKAAGLKRNGKSCRLRWVNYLRPDLKRSRITLDEELVIIDLHRRLGNRWSRIAQHLPGRTDNEIKNYFRNHIRKKIMCKPEDHVEFQSKTVQGERSVKADQQMGGKHSDPLKENQMTVINEWIGGGCEFFGNEFQNYCRSLSMDDISVSPQSSSESSEFVDYTDQLWNVFDNNALAQ